MIETFALIGGSILFVTIVSVLLACIVVLICCIMGQRKKPKDCSFKVQGNEAYGSTPLYEQVHQTNCKYPTAEFTGVTLPSLCHFDDNYATAEGFVKEPPSSDADSSGDHVISECCQMSPHEDNLESFGDRLSDEPDRVEGQEFERVKIFECCPNLAYADKGAQLSGERSTAVNKDPEQMQEYECVHHDETTMQLINGVIRPYERLCYSKAVEKMVAREHSVLVAGHGLYGCNSGCDGWCCRANMVQYASESGELCERTGNYESVWYGEEAIEILRKMPDVTYSDSKSCEGVVPESSSS